MLLMILNKTDSVSQKKKRKKNHLGYMGYTHFVHKNSQFFQMFLRDALPCFIQDLPEVCGITNHIPLSLLVIQDVRGQVTGQAIIQN